MPSAWLNVSHFRQDFNYSCVAACARMVLAGHGRSLSEADLRQLIGTNAYGTPAAGVLRLGSLGFDVQLGASSLAQLQAALAVSVAPIVFLQTGTLDYWTNDAAHAAVLVGLDATNAFLNDPFFDAYPQQTSLAGFQAAWASTGHLAATIRLRP